MKNAIKLTLAAVLTAGAARAQADLAPAPPPPGPVDDGRSPPPPPPGPGLRLPPPEQREQVTVSGKVRQFILAPRGEVDGLLLADGREVRVPPHLSDALTGAIRVGDAISIEGGRESADVVVARTITNTQTGKQVTDSGPGRRPPPPAPDRDPSAGLSRLSVQGSVAALLHGPRGEINGAVLDNGAVVRLSPQAALYYGELLQAGTRISASGMGVENRFGKVVEAQELHRS